MSLCLTHAPTHPTRRVLPEEYITTRLHSLRVRGVREDGTVASYRQDSDGGAFVINMEELEDYRKFDLLSLTLHEGNPGHHLTGYANPHRSEQPHFLRTGGQCCHTLEKLRNQEKTDEFKAPLGKIAAQCLFHSCFGRKSVADYFKMLG